MGNKLCSHGERRWRQCWQCDAETDTEIEFLRAQLAEQTAEVERLRAEAACPCGEPAKFSDHWCGKECPRRYNTPLALLRAENERLRRQLAAATEERDRLRDMLKACEEMNEYLEQLAGSANVLGVERDRALEEVEQLREQLNSQRASAEGQEDE